MHDILVISLEVDHAMNEALLLGVLSAPSPEHDVWSRNIGEAQ